MTSDEAARADLEKLVKGLNRPTLERLAIDLCFAVAHERLDKMIAAEVERVSKVMDARELAGYEPTADAIRLAYAKVVFENLDSEKGAIN